MQWLIKRQIKRWRHTGRREEFRKDIRSFDELKEASEEYEDGEYEEYDDEDEESEEVDESEWEKANSDKYISRLLKKNVFIVLNIFRMLLNTMSKVPLLKTMVNII